MKALSAVDAGLEQPTTRTYAKKLTVGQLMESEMRVAWGEPTRKLAREFGVTEGALRYHWRKSGHPRETMRIAQRMFRLEQQLATLSPKERRMVQREVERQLGQQPASIAQAHILTALCAPTGER